MEQLIQKFMFTKANGVDGGGGGGGGGGRAGGGDQK